MGMKDMDLIDIEKEFKKAFPRIKSYRLGYRDLKVKMWMGSCGQIPHRELYFITICTPNLMNHMGDAHKGKRHFLLRCDTREHDTLFYFHTAKDVMRFLKYHKKLKSKLLKKSALARFVYSKF